MLIEAAVLSAALMVQVPNVRNPRSVEFTCADHDRDDQHELDILDSQGRLVQTLLLGDPAADAGGVVRASINVQPINFGVGYTAVVRAVASAVKSDNSEPSNPFDRVPGQPSSVVVK